MLTVTVVINNYNYGRFLAAAIDSALQQTHGPSELIVVDDGSTDDSRTILAGYRGVITAILQTNQGQAAALNAGIRRATGDIVCLLDSDDVWFPHKLAEICSVFEEYPQVSWLRHKLSVCDQALVPRNAFIPAFSRSGLMPRYRAFFSERLAAGSTSALCFRRTLVQDLVPIPALFTQSADAYLTSSAYDADAYICARLGGSPERGYSLDKTLGKYRRHDKQQYATTASICSMLDRQVTVDLELARALSYGYIPSSVAKHRLILTALSGSRRLSFRRFALLREGCRSCAGILSRGTLQLCCQQTVKLLIAFIAPRWWLKKLCERTGFDSC